MYWGASLGDASGLFVSLSNLESQHCLLASYSGTSDTGTLRRKESHINQGVSISDCPDLELPL